MLEGWRNAVEWSKAIRYPNDSCIRTLGNLVEPRKNQTTLKYRQGNVRVGYDVKLDWRKVDDSMGSLVRNLDSERFDPVLDAGEWYRQFEEIHPFLDGNGRCGSILWNWIRGNLLYPSAPPDYWSEPTDDEIASTYEAIEAMQSSSVRYRRASTVR